MGAGLFVKWKLLLIYLGLVPSRQCDQFYKRFTIRIYETMQSHSLKSAIVRLLSRKLQL